MLVMAVSPSSLTFAFEFIWRAINLKFILLAAYYLGSATSLNTGETWTHGINASTASGKTKAGKEEHDSLRKDQLQHMLDLCTRASVRGRQNGECQVTNATRHLPWQINQHRAECGE
jgi:hypothetical protein